MNNSLNHMPCSNSDHVDRPDFFENNDEAMFMFEPINITPKEPLLNDELNVMHETFTCSVNYRRVCLKQIL
jgi:hypothetical protein